MQIQEIFQGCGIDIGPGQEWQMTKNALGGLHEAAENYMVAVFESANHVRRATGDDLREVVSTHLSIGPLVLCRC